jgi:hypothetical protein
MIFHLSYFQRLVTVPGNPATWLKQSGTWLLFGGWRGGYLVELLAEA